MAPRAENPGSAGWLLALVVGALAMCLALAACTTERQPSTASVPRESTEPTAPTEPTEPTSVAPTLPTPTVEAKPTPEPCPRAPEVPKGETLFGLNVSTSSQSYPEAVAGLDDTFGYAPVVRVFDPSIPPRTAWQNRGPLLRGRMVVASFRMPPADVLAGRYDEELRHWFATAPRDLQLFWTYFHEVEPEINSGHFTAEEFRRAFRHIVKVAQEVCRPRQYPILVLTGYTADPASKRDWRRYYPGREWVSLLAWDPYNNASGVPSSYGDPADLVDPVVEISRAAGKPFGIAETGSQLVPGDSDGSGRAAWLREIARYFEEQGAVFVLYYSSIGVSGADYRLRDQPSIRAWSSVMRAP